MGKKNIYSMLFYVFFIFSVLLGLYCYGNIAKIRNLEKSIPIPGYNSKLSGTLVLVNSLSEVKKFDLSVGKFLVYNYSRTCSTCDKNFGLWKRISQNHGQNIHILGIAENPDDICVLSEMLVPASYSLFMPHNATDYVKLFNRTTNLAQTLYIVDGTVKFSYLGELQMEDYNHLLRIMKE